MAADQLELDFDNLPQQLLTADDMFAGLDEGNLRKWTEMNKLEVKSALIQPDHLGDYFSMWANTPPYGGIVAIGISKNYDFEGCLKVGIEKTNNLERTGSIYCPDAEFKFKEVKIKRDKDGESDFVLAFRIKYHPTKVVRTSKGEVFTRRGESLTKLNDDQIRSLRHEKGEINYEKEPCGLEYPKAFRRDDIARFVASVRSKRTWQAPHSDEEVLKLHMLGAIENGKFQPNIACALLFANDPRSIIPGCRVRFLRFEGNEEGSGAGWNAVKDEYLDGTVPELIVKSDAILKSQLRTFSRLGAGGKFVTSPEYPEFAWHEALVNALAHRSYSNGLKNTAIFIKMFDNRLVIESPGPFMPFVNPDNIYESQAARNPYLMDALYYLEYVRAANEGTRRMRHEMAQVALPAPEFGQEIVGHSKVRVTLKNRIDQRKQWVDTDVADIVGASVASSLNESEIRCINHIAEHGSINVSEAIRLTGQAWETAKRMLMGLVDQRILVHDHKHGAQFDKRDSRASFKLNK